MHSLTYVIPGESREELIEEYLPLVNRMANRLAMGLPSHVDRDDLVSTGVMGLLDALEKYNPALGPLKSYVPVRIQGAMLDELRKMSWLPRTLLAKTKELEKGHAVLSNTLGRSPSEEELAEYLQIDKKEVLSLLAHISSKSLLHLEDFLFADDEGKRSLGEFVADKDESKIPEASLMKKEQNKLLAAAIETLTEREQLILHLYYQDELTLKEIGTVLDVSESRISQIHSRIMLKMRQELKD